MKGPCEHCGNADKANWLSQCLYKGSFPSRRAFILSTFDPPCASDAYDEGQRELAKDRKRHFVMLIVGPILLVIFIILMVKS